MKPWWDNPEYHSATTDNKITAWADHCKAMRKALDEAEYELRKFGAFAGRIERWERDIATANARLDRPEGAKETP